MQAAGFTGDEQYVAAHSLGTVMAQDYVLKKAPKLFKGMVMMGGSLMRDKRTNDNSTGLTYFDYPVPTLVLAGNKDGLYRITRNAESWWHQMTNIVPREAGRYPVVLLKGVSHGSFMDDTMLPKLIIKDDLRPEVTQDQGYSMVASNMVSFIANIRGDKDVAEKALKGFKNEGEEFFAPFIEAMKLEGSYNMKIPCYNWNLVNPQSGLECMSGSPWVTQSQVRMGGDTSDVGVSLDTYDNFHRVYTTKPHHIP